MNPSPDSATRAQAEGFWGLGRAETLRLLPIFLPVTLAGLAALGASAGAYAAAPPAPGDLIGTAVLLAAAIFAEAYPVPVDRLPAGSVSLAAVFVLSAGILFGWKAAIVVGFITRATLEVAHRRPLVKLLYNGAVYAQIGRAHV